jgi:tetratricopeptide (TPR) repeat protein
LSQTDKERYWYERGTRKFQQEGLDEHLEDMRNVMNVAAATSPAAEPLQNLQRTLGVMAENEQGVPISTDLTQPGAVRLELTTGMQAPKTTNYTGTFLHIAGIDDKPPISVNDRQHGEVLGMDPEELAKRPDLYALASQFTQNLRDAENNARTGVAAGTENPFESWQIQAPAWSWYRDCYLRALVVFHPMTKGAVFEALGLLEQAIAIDQHYGPALAFAAACHMQFVNYSWAEDPATARRKAVDLARRALHVAGYDPGVVASAAMILAVFGEDIGTMTALADQALALNPSSARGWHHSGFLRLMAGEPDRAIELAEVSLRLSPRARVGPVHTVIGASHFLSQRFDEAIAKLLLAIEETPNFPVPYRYLAACYAHKGRLEEARDVVKRLRVITPVVMPPDIMYLRNAEHRELYLSGLRLAARRAA